MVLFRVPRVVHPWLIKFGPIRGRGTRSLLSPRGRPKSLAAPSMSIHEMTGAIPRTATRDLDDLVGKGLFKKVGSVGRGAHYVLGRKPEKNRTNQTTPAAHAKSDIN